MSFLRSLLLLLIATSTQAAPVLLISIDGLQPDYVFKADGYGLKTPVLRRFLRDGSFARGVVAAVPTVTYPNHTTMLTGVTPAEHGILANTPFDPRNENREGWYWYAEDIRVPTLWSAADAAGLVTASVNWPVTVGDRHIRYSLPEYWRASTTEDAKLLRALSQPPDLQSTLEKMLGTSFVDGNTESVAADATRTRFAIELMRQHRPAFTAVHLIALDGMEHHYGPFTPEAFATLESLDSMIGQLSAAALVTDPQTVIAVVSDHGFIATHTAVNLRTRFVEAGLIELNAVGVSPDIKSWQAQVWSGGAVAAIVLRDPSDVTVRDRVRKLLDELRADTRNGMARILDRRELADRGAFTGAEFLVEFAPGYYLGSALRGELLTSGTSKGTHGYLADRPEMHASFFVNGQGIVAGKNLGIVDMKQIAPTLAQLLQISLPTARSPALQVQPTITSK
jgi:predicted AlkP superfamily pyrophosphatase or phosphodiesterase